MEMVHFVQDEQQAGCAPAEWDTVISFNRYLVDSFTSVKPLGFRFV